MPRSETLDPAADSRVFAREWAEWHRAHERRRADPHGFLAVTGLHWLGERPTVLPDAPGSWTSGPDGVEVTLAEGEWLEIDGHRIEGVHRFPPLAERSGITAAFGGGVIEIAKRGGRDILRPRRPDAEFLDAYAGTPAYPADPFWRAAARFVPFDAPRSVTVGAAVDGIQHVYEAPGELEFELGGETFRLTAFPGHGEGELLVLFTDATSGVTTYAANRSLAVTAPDAEGRTVIDFNRAVNLPCAYTDFATCPLPPEGNRLPIGIEAGEQTPSTRVLGAPAGAGLIVAGTTA